MTALLLLNDIKFYILYKNSPDAGEFLRIDGSSAVSEGFTIVFRRESNFIFSYRRQLTSCTQVECRQRRMTALDPSTRIQTTPVLLKRTGNLHRRVRGVMYKFDTPFISRESRLQEFTRLR